MYALLKEHVSFLILVDVNIHFKKIKLFQSFVHLKLQDVVCMETILWSQQTTNLQFIFAINIILLAIQENGNISLKTFIFPFIITKVQ